MLVIRSAVGDGIANQFETACILIYCTQNIVNVTGGLMLANVLYA